MTGYHGCRIGKVKFKSGGQMHVLDSVQQGDPEVVEMLLGVLDDVRRGIVVSVGVITVCEDGSVGTGFAYGDEIESHHLIKSGAVTLLRRLGDLE